MSRKFDFLKGSKGTSVEILSTQTSESLTTQTPEISDIRIAALSRTRGRPAGKRTDPDYAQVTAYIRKGTHHGVKLLLLQEGQGREFSELVEELLSSWLAEVKVKTGSE